MDNEKPPIPTRKCDWPLPLLLIYAAYKTVKWVLMLFIGLWFIELPSRIVCAFLPKDPEWLPKFRKAFYGELWDWIQNNERLQ